MHAKPFVMNLALTGATTTKAMNRNVPLSHAEIIDDVARCMEFGIQIVHLHCRDEQGQQTSDPELYGRLIENIRGLPGGRELVVGVTTTGRMDSRLESRSRVLALDGLAKPDMASLTLSSLNFMQSASVNQPETIRRLAELMKERSIKPELEVFDLGMANFAKVLLQEGVLEPPLYINILLGNIAGAQANALQFSTIMTQLPENSMVTLGGLGRFQFSANILGLLEADGARIGLEDNLWFDHSRLIPASNPSLVQRLVSLCEQFERPLMPTLELRKELGLRLLP